MTQPQPIPQQRPAPAELAPILESDIAEVAAFIAAESGKSPETVEPHLRWFLLENPARQPQDTLGFGLRAGLRDNDQLVGCILCSPQTFCFGIKKIVLMGSSSFYVEDRYRGQGGRIFLQYSRLAKQWPLFGTSANAQAAALWSAAGASPIPYSEGELFGVLHWAPVAEELMHRQNTNRILARLAGSAASNVVKILKPLKIDRVEPDALQLLASAEQVDDLSILAPSTRLTAWRDITYIRWRYFSGRDATAAAFAFRSRHLDREILVTVNQRPRGYRAQINTLNVLDVYPEVPAEEWLRIVGALISRYKKSIDAIVLRSQNPERQKLFCDRGFQARTFDAPNAWFLDKAKLLRALDWYPVPANGDGLI
jgi:hypothetical protein